VIDKPPVRRYGIEVICFVQVYLAFEIIGVINGQPLGFAIEGSKQRQGFFTLRVLYRQGSPEK
jgi:hypothetical protein